MKVVSVKIHNILGIEDFEIAPKSVTRFEGRNAVGKTSALEAIKAAIKGGHDATLLRNGADEGQIVVILDDGLEIKKTVTADKTDLSVKYPRSGVKIDKPQTHLNALVDALSVNPVEFLNAPASKRAEYLLQAMPLKVTRGDLEGICDSAMIHYDEHAFTVLAAVDKLLYDERTGVNRLKDEKRKTAKQLGKTLPVEEDPTDWSAKAKELTQALANTRSDLKNAKEKVEQTYKEGRATIEIEVGRRQGITEAEYQKRLRELQAWKTGEMNDIAAFEKIAIESETNTRSAGLEDAGKSMEPKITELTSALAEAETKAKRQNIDNQTHSTIARVEQEAEKHESDSAALTMKLDDLNALRMRILSNLPIPGVTVENGQVMKDGVVYDRLNTAAQIDIAVAIAKIRAKELGIVCVDGLECLDEENFAAFEAAMQASGLQCFITRVTNPDGAVMEVTTK